MILNAEPIIPFEATAWLSCLFYAPGCHVELPEHIDEFHAHYYLTKHNCVDLDGRLVADGVPTNIIKSLSVNINKGVINNVSLTR